MSASPAVSSSQLRIGFWLALLLDFPSGSRLTLHIPPHARIPPHSFLMPLSLHPALFLCLHYFDSGTRGNCAADVYISMAARSTL